VNRFRTADACIAVPPGEISAGLIAFSEPPMPLSDDANRFLKIKAASASAALALVSFEGQEAISQPFRFVLDMIADDPALDMLKMVGQPLTFSTNFSDDDVRHFHGKVLRISAGALEKIEEGEIRRFRAEVVPSLWFLKFNQNCRVFQDKTAPQIIEQVCKDIGWSTSDYSLSLGGTYAKLEYCVQYNESDYHFVSRLMEEAGIFYYFQHDKNGHKLVASDKSSGYVDCQENQVEFADRFEGFQAGQIFDWERQLEFTTGKFSHTDYNFETPDTKLLVSEKTVVKTKGVDGYELYEYPGEYLKNADGKTIATARIEALEWPNEVVTGTSTCASFLPGGKFKIKTHPVAAEKNKSYALLSVQHRGSEASLRIGADGNAASGDRPDYTNNFQCIPAATVFRPPRTTPKPRTWGLQTAMVVGGKNQEILADKYGRVKIQFPWDREGKLDDKSSCWVRVAQTWAGSKRGSLFTPRVGDEVVVDFLEGDPDRPLIVGSLYNANNMPPYEPDKKSYQSGIKTYSTDKGKAKNFNELLFEDKIGKEQIYFHAERDFVRIVENDDKLKIGFEVKDKGDQTIDIYNDRTVTIDKGIDTLHVKTKDRVVKIDKGNHLITVDTGDQKITITKGSLFIEAKQKIVLKVGKSEMQMTQTDIKFKGMNFDLKSDMVAKVKGGIKLALEGGAMATLKGGIVKIN
jgi:type VI secretion system secreted protein VgrG